MIGNNKSRKIKVYAPKILIIYFYLLKFNNLERNFGISFFNLIRFLSKTIFDKMMFLEINQKIQLSFELTKKPNIKPKIRVQK